MTVKVVRFGVVIEVLVGILTGWVWSEILRFVVENRVLIPVNLLTNYFLDSLVTSKASQNMVD